GFPAGPGGGPCPAGCQRRPGPWPRGCAPLLAAAGPAPAGRPRLLPGAWAAETGSRWYSPLPRGWRRAWTEFGWPAACFSTTGGPGPAPGGPAWPGPVRQDARGPRRMETERLYWSISRRLRRL